MDLTDRHRAREGSAPADERYAAAASEPAPHVPTDAVARPHPPASGEGPAVRVAPQPPSAGTAATPIPFVRKPALLAAAYALTSMLLSLSQGLGLNFVSANIYQLAGPLHATLNEANWLIAAYMAPNVSLSLMLIKIRNQYGLRRFAEGSIVCFVVSCLLYFWVSDLSSALVVRFISGIAASPMSSLGFLYMLELFPPETKFLRGLPLALTTNALGSPMARLLSPDLLDRGGWHRLGLLEMGIACLAFAGVYLLPLTSPPRVKTIEPLDFLSYGLLAIGFGAAAVVATLGRLYWWLEADWLGWLLALSLAALTASVLLELNRPRPFIDLRWLATPGMLYAALVLLLFRLVLSEQALGGSSFLNAIGLLNDQARGLNLCIVAATLAGGWGCALVFRPQNAWALMTVAMGCIAVGAWLDSHATDLTRPREMMLSQSLIAFGGALFLPVAMSSGFTVAVKRGINGILTFICIFLATQSLGGVIGSGLFGTFVTWREKYHDNRLVEHLAATDPQVAARSLQLGRAYARILPDPALQKAEGLAQLGAQATRQANILAYNDAFLLIAGIAAGGFVLLVGEALLKRWRRPASIPAT